MVRFYYPFCRTDGTWAIFARLLSILRQIAPCCNRQHYPNICITMRRFTKLYFILPILILFSSFSYAQSLRAYERAANEAFQNKNYGEAAGYYATVLKKKPESTDVLWKYAESVKKINSYAEAEKSYKKILSDKSGAQDYPLAMFRMGEIKKGQGDYNAAIEYFEKYLSSGDLSDVAYLERANAQIETCREAQTIIENTKMVPDVVHLGREINSNYYDFAPVYVGDTLFFSSYRFDKKSKDSDKKLSKVMMSVAGGRAKQPGKDFPTTDTAHIAHTAFSPDGHYVFFSVCKDLNALDKHCELWLTVLDRKMRWLPPVKLPEPINASGYSTTQPAVGYDSMYQGPVLWFSSNRPGGKGNYDLWYTPLDTNFFCPCNLPLTTKKIGRLPRFKKPVNAEIVNTSENEMTPFYDGVSQELWFSTEGLGGLGGYDVFRAKKDSIFIDQPKNAGPGINSSYNDLYFFLKKDGVNGYLSSNRPGSYYLDDANKTCCNDIFTVKLPQVPVETPPVVSTPPVTNETSLAGKSPALETPPTAPAIPAAPVVTLNDFVGLPLYFDNDEPDKKTNKTNTALTYEETIRRYLEAQSTYRERFTEGLKSEEADKAEAMVNEFFDKEVRTGFERLNQLSDMLLPRLEAGENIEIIIKGYTSPRAQSEYNFRLAYRRISSIRNHFMNYNDGALRPYMQKGQFVISEAGIGETTANSKISDELKDEKGSIYHPDAARERRVEIVEIKQQK